MNQQHIHCIVDNCHYWKQGNMCDANEILVVSDNFGAQQPDTIDAPAAKNLTTVQSDSCMDTCCKTFVEKNSQQINADGVKRM